MIGSKKITDFLKKYIVTILFLVLSLTFILLGDLDMTSVARDLMKRLSRNAFIVLSLIIPIVAGMGINFAITIGAMAAQIGLLLAINWNLTGPLGILVAAASGRPLWLPGGCDAEQDERPGDHRLHDFGLLCQRRLSAAVPLHLRQFLSFCLILSGIIINYENGLGFVEYL